MKKTKCHECGQYHDWDKIEVIFKFPDTYFDIPEDERNERVKANREICVIDEEHYLRGVLPVPVSLKQKTFYRWGVWVKVDLKTFRVIYDNWEVEDQSHLKGLKGKLANEIRFYEKTLNKALRIQPISNKVRPHFYFSHDRRLMEIQDTTMKERDLMDIYHYHFEK